MKSIAVVLMSLYCILLAGCDKGKKPYEEAEVQFNKSDYATAKSKAAEVIQNSPQSKYVVQAKALDEKITRIEGLLNTAKEAVEIEDYKQAIKNYEEILSAKNNPTNSAEMDTLQKTKEAYKKKLMDDGILLYVDNGDYEKGIESFKEVLRLFPNDTNATAALKQTETTYSSLKQLGDEVMEQFRIFVQAIGTRNDDVATVAKARFRESAYSLFKINGGRPYLTLRINEYLREAETALNDFLSKSKAFQRVEKRDQRIIAADDYNHALTKFVANYGRPEAWLEKEMNQIMKEKKGWDLLPLYHDDEENLLEAAFFGQISVVRRLIAVGTNVNTKDGQGHTALIWAGQEGHIEIAKLLIEKGAILYAKDHRGWTALMAAANKGQIEVAKLLIEKGASIDTKAKDGWTALMAAAKKRHREIVKLLIEKGAKIDSKDNVGMTALAYASLASYYIGKNDYNKANENNEKALELTLKEIEKKPSAGKYISASWYALFVARFSDAEEYASKGLSLDPKVLELHTNLGHAYLFQGKKTEAIAEYKKFINSYKDKPKDVLKDDFSQLKKRYPDKVSLIEWAEGEMGK